MPQEKKIEKRKAANGFHVSLAASQVASIKIYLAVLDILFYSRKKKGDIVFSFAGIFLALVPFIFFKDGIWWFLTNMQTYATLWYADAEVIGYPFFITSAVETLALLAMPFVIF